MIHVKNIYRIPVSSITFLIFMNLYSFVLNAIAIVVDEMAGLRQIIYSRVVEKAST